MLKRFLRLSALNIIANLSIPLAGLIDTAMLGHLPEIYFLAGVSLGAILFDYLYWTFGFLRMATTGLTAQAMGRDDGSEIFNQLYRPLMTAVCIAAIILLLRVYISDLGFSLLSGEENVLQAAQGYFSYRIWGAPAVLANFVFIGWFLGREQSSRALIMTVCANFSNVFFNYIFIIRLNMAAEGAGLATMLSQYVMLAVGISLFLAVKKKKWSWSAIFHGDQWQKIFKLNLDIMLRTVCLVFSFSVFTNYSSQLSVTILAVNSILRDLMVFAAYLIDGSAFAVESLAGTFFGERNLEKLRSLMRMALGASVLFAAFFLLILFFFSTSIFNLFTSHQVVLKGLLQYWPWLIPILLVGAVAFTFDGFFLGLSKGNVLRNTMFLSTLLFLPVAYYGLVVKSNLWLWASLLTFMLVRAISTAFSSRYVFRAL